MPNDSSSDKILSPDEVMQRAANEGRVTIRFPAKIRDFTAQLFTLAKSNPDLSSLIIEATTEHATGKGQGKRTKITMTDIYILLTLSGQYAWGTELNSPDRSSLLIPVSEYTRESHRVEMLKIIDHFDPDYIDLLLLAHNTESDTYNVDVMTVILDHLLRRLFLIEPPDPQLFYLRYESACRAMHAAKAKLLMGISRELNATREDI